jgi:hypothetical protein
MGTRRTTMVAPAAALLKRAMNASHQANPALCFLVLEVASSARANNPATRVSAIMGILVTAVAQYCHAPLAATTELAGCRTVTTATATLATKVRTAAPRPLVQ